LPRSFDAVFYGAAGTPTGATDDEFNRTSFLSHFEGANNGVNNAFDDSSASNHTISLTGNVTQGSFGPFARPDGDWGCYFDGSDYLSMPDSGDFELASGDFTVAAWLFPHVDGSGYQPVITHASHSGNAGWGIWYQANKLQFFVNNASTTVYITSGTFTANEWTHVAAVRTGNTIKLFINGDEDVSTSISDFNNSTTTLTIGASPNWNSTYYYTGIISNILVLKGTALYTGDFTPPTSKYTAITNTKLLTCQSNRFVDNSASGHTVTPSGNAAVTAFGPFLTSAVYDPAVNGASAYLDGDGDSLVLADSSDFELGSGDFTIAMWVYPEDLIPPDRAYNNLALMMHSTYYGTAVGWSMFWQTTASLTNCFRFMVNGTARIYDAEGFFGRQWTYLTAVRTGNTLKLFINGVQKVSTSFADFSNSTTTLTIGASPNWQSDVYKFGGQMSDVFICKGTAVYTSNFTPPTAPLTAITNTKLLLNMADGQAIDSAAQNNLTLFGNAKISTGQAKFGGTSLYLDGTGDAAQIATTTNSFAFGTGDYTVEMWLYLTAVNENDQIFDMRTSDSSVNPGSYLDGSARPNLYISGGVRLTSNTAISANTWTHFAICRASGTTRIFQAGQVTGTLNSDTYNIVAGKLMLGARYNSASTNNGQGYWEDVRASNMARYTANFSPPTQPFPDKGQ